MGTSAAIRTRRLNDVVSRYGIDAVLAVARGVVAGLPLGRLGETTQLKKRALRRIRAAIGVRVRRWHPDASACAAGARPALFLVGVAYIGSEDTPEWVTLSEQQERGQRQEPQQEPAAGPVVGRARGDGRGA